MLRQTTGIHLSESKKILLEGRLSRRLRELGLSSFAEYFRLVTQAADADELQTMVDLLTTNETYFFREPQHFDFLMELAGRQRRRGGVFRAWSAAASSGEEAYSMAMVLAEALGDTPWEIVGTDISSRVLVKAQNGHYPLDRIGGIPPALLRKYCLKGVRDQEGTMLVVRELRRRVQFLQGNLLHPPRNLGLFDVIFLRNVMIYFDQDTKRRVVANLLPCLKREGFLVVGHSESLGGLSESLQSLRPTIYRLAAAGPAKDPM